MKRPPVIRGQGLGVGEVAQMWGTTTAWVRSHLPVRGDGRIASAALSEFIAHEPEIFECRPRVD